MSNFWKTLFDEGEEICLTNTVYGTDTSEFHTDYEQFFCINPLNGPRRDSNVSSFRNILLEFDHGSPADQLSTLTDTPHSTLVWSGGKSHHAIISLEEPCEDRAAYDVLVRRIYEKLPTADKSVKNPSRLSRTPNATRNNGNVQYLIHVKDRISRETLETWLGPVPANLKTEQPQRKSLHLSPWTKYFLMFGSQPGQRNADLFKAACDMLRHGYSPEVIQERASEVLDLPMHEIRSTIKSAAAAVRRST